jgi:hypothetical protein
MGTSKWLWLCFLSAACCGTQAAEGIARISVDVSCSNRLPEQMSLDISITNTGDQPITLYKADLPWGTRHSLILVPITSDQKQRRLEESLFVDDPGPGTVTIQPSQRLSGRVELSKRFPELLTIVKKTDVIIFWSYQAELTSGTKTSRISGGRLLGPGDNVSCAPDGVDVGSP